VRVEVQSLFCMFPKFRRVHARYYLGIANFQMGEV
jgi:hypothetical protein